MKRLTIIQSILLFIFGVIIIGVIQVYYHDYIYSEQEVILRITDEFNGKSEEYMAFFDYAQNLKYNINWDTLDVRLREVDYKINQEISVNFKMYGNESGGIVYDGLRGVIFYLPNIDFSIKEDIIPKEIKEETGLSITQLDSLRSYMNRLEEGEMFIYKDGSVIIEKLIGPELFDMEQYHIVRTGERMFLYGNYRDAGYGTFIGKKN